MKQKHASATEIETYLSMNGYRFRRNVVRKRTEFLKNGVSFELVTDLELNSILRSILKAGLICTKSFLRDLLYSDFAPEFDPFKAYYERLAPWNESQPDYIQQLADTVQTTQQALWREWFKKWLVAVVACAINPSIVNHEVLVLVGKQAAGKTTWLNRLLPTELKDYLYSGPINPNNKDALIHAAECLLVNLDELEILNKTEIGNLKSLITQLHINVRKPYGYNPENLTRRASFMGSVNDVEFLSDTTGNRRYLCFTTVAIDNGHGVDVNRAYAQAYQLYLQGFQYWFDKNETKTIERINRQYKKSMIEQELLEKYYRKPEGDEGYELKTATEIAQHLSQLSGCKLNDAQGVRRVGMVLRSLGFNRTSKDNSKYYRVKFVDRAANDLVNDFAKLHEMLLPGYFYLYRS